MRPATSLRTIRIKWRWALAFILLSACVERIDFDVPPAQQLLVVEGMISNNPGPYTVRVSTAINLDADSLLRPPVEHATIRLFDDDGNTEPFVEESPGVYVTGGAIQGQVGHAYHIQIETTDGKIFESDPDILHAGGEVDDIRYEYEARTKEESFGEVPADVFNIYIDAHAAGAEENYVRWRYTGTYKVHSNPELHSIFLQVSSYADPRPCSGYIITPALGGGKLVQVGECTCCTCWVNEFESEPQLSDVQLVTDGQFRNIKIAEVPINQATFYDKFNVQVEQMSLSRTSFEFFRLVRAQKEGASSLFQPPSGEIVGNVHAVNNGDRIVGIFWAAGLSTKSIYILRSEVPYPLPPIFFVPDACNSHYPNSSTTQPEFWE